MRLPSGALFVNIQPLRKPREQNVRFHGPDVFKGAQSLAQVAAHGEVLLSPDGKYQIGQEAAAERRKSRPTSAPHGELHSEPVAAGDFES